MLKTFVAFFFTLLLSFALPFSACGPSGEKPKETTAEKGMTVDAGATEKTSADAPMKKPPFGNADDLDTAKKIWAEIKGYRKWDHFPGKEGDAKGFVDGKPPHGKYVRLFTNKKSDLTADGTIVIKENLGAKDEAKLGTITVMKKIKGFNPDEGDWFWIKFNPKGEVMKNDKGMSLAGKVGKGGTAGCIPCHSNYKAKDFLPSKP